jgi:hypothetical protein
MLWTQLIDSLSDRGFQQVAIDYCLQPLNVKESLLVRNFFEFEQLEEFKSSKTSIIWNRVIRARFVRLRLK